jgi:hypothetical protein
VAEGMIPFSYVAINLYKEVSNPPLKGKSKHSFTWLLEKRQKMKSPISSTLVALGLAALASTAPTFNPAVSPECAYPIGTGGENAKVSGRLFNIDGHVKYFAGNNEEEILNVEDSNATKVRMHGGSHI